MEYLTVASGEAKTVSYTDDVAALATFDLGEDIAVTCYNPATKSVGLARDVQSDELKEFIRGGLSDEDVDPYPVLQIRLVGGDASEASREKLKKIVSALAEVDQNRDVLNIISADVNDKFHPEDFKITAFDGKIGEVE